MVGVDLDDVVLDLNARQVVVAGVGELSQRPAHEPATVQRHRLPVGEIDVAQHPAGPVGPGQDAERRGVRHEHDVREAGHLLEAESAASGEGRHEHLIAGVEAVDGTGEVEAVGQGSDRHLRRQRLSARHPVLVNDDQPDGTQVAFTDLARDRLGRGGLRGCVQAVSRDEARLAYAADVMLAAARAAGCHLAVLRSG